MTLAILFIISICPTGLFEVTAAAEKIEGGYTYTVSDGCATIIKADASISGDITIPKILGGYTVTSIGSDAFNAHNDLTAVTIPDSVTSVGNNAFSNCKKLKSITIPDSVTVLGISIFQYCTGLERVKIGGGIEGIEKYMFEGCTALKSIEIPNAVTSIGNKAFYGCDEYIMWEMKPNGAKLKSIQTMYRLKMPKCIITIPEYREWKFCQSRQS